jgi:hypothetical protein
MFYWPFIVFHILSVILGLIVAVLLLIFGSTLFGVVESLPKDLPQLEMSNQASRPLLPNSQSSETYHAPKPFYGENDFGPGKLHFQSQLDMQKDYHSARQLAEAIGASLSALIIFGSILMMLLFSFYAYLINVVIRSYRYLRASTTMTTYNKLADERQRFA